MLFFVILERDYEGSNGKVYYGLFKSIGKVCLGFAMARYNPETQGSRDVQRLVIEALQYDPDDRAS